LYLSEDPRYIYGYAVIIARGSIAPDQYDVKVFTHLRQILINLKKACLNTYCEQIKEDTVSIIQEAQRRTIEKINTFDTYDFDQTVFQSSFTEGVWEPETLLRITDVIFKDEIRGLMLDQGYVNKTNGMICAAREVSGIKVDLKDEQDSHKEKFKLRHQELYESPKLLNQLRRPIDNGDIFKITSGAKSGKTLSSSLRNAT
jgi:hypothetical protein